MKAIWKTVFHSETDCESESSRKQDRVSRTQLRSDDDIKKHLGLQIPHFFTSSQGNQSIEFRSLWNLSKNIAGSLFGISVGNPHVQRPGIPRTAQCLRRTRMQVKRLMILSILPIATSTAPLDHLEADQMMTKVGNNRRVNEKRLRRAVFDLIPATANNWLRREIKLCRKCEVTRKRLGTRKHRGSVEEMRGQGRTERRKHGGTFADYNKFIGRHSAGHSRRSRKKMKKLFLMWLHQEKRKAVMDVDVEAQNI